MRKQTIKSAPAKVFVETYITKSGQTKNRYRINPESKDLKVIKHNN